jgi:hypothetical protein|tara:strand:+ start:1454 stop:1735 length:282 start_codon:yes stop_codon:yes gene_type:complete
MSAFEGWSQLIDATLYLNWKDGVFNYGSKISTGIYDCGADRDVGSLATWRVIKGNWPGVWEAVLLNLFSDITLGRDTAATPSPLKVGFNIGGT